MELTERIDFASTVASKSSSSAREMNALYALMRPAAWSTATQEQVSEIAPQIIVKRTVEIICFVVPERDKFTY